MCPFSKEDVVKLAFRIYKENWDLSDSVWKLAELCVTINKNIKNGYDIKPLETENLVLLIREDVNGEILKPPEDEIREVAEVIYGESPSKSELDWYIAEKKLLLDEIKNIINQVKSVNGTFISLWHNESLSDQKRWKGWRRVYEEMIKYATF